MFMGNKTDYEVDNIDKWRKATPSNTTINEIHSDHPLITTIMSKRELGALEKLYLYPVIQADLMKIIALYYYGGASVDLDVIPHAQYPAYLDEHPKTKDCDIMFGIEHERYSIEEIPPVRKGQLQTWASFARIKRSEFVRALLDRILYEIEHTQTGQGEIGYYDVQEIAGSGIITDFVNEQACDYLDTTVVDGFSWHNLKMFPQSVVNCKWRFESVCVLGKEWTGVDCNRYIPSCILEHQFRGTWKGDYTDRDLAYKGYYGKPKKQIGKIS
ncbi:membrane-bound alpha-1,6- mannosyltransferase Initiation-specific [Boothiomyces sp. JEL0866]|nr:membrane-bound alpha-1,6- mannosyltransferase Initiation-specific [Boothiomyces sp. JEL0866]